MVASSQKQTFTAIILNTEFSRKQLKIALFGRDIWDKSAVALSEV
jgi:hypothetical protein